MGSITVLPSDIRFSQNNISNRFSSALDNEYIGIVVDKIYDGDENLKKRIRDNLKVGRWKKPGYEDLWFTVNNRSLWVLKELQLLGKITQPIIVQIDSNGIDKQRFSTKNKGTCVEVRQQPVGGVHSKPAPFWRYKPHDIAGAAGPGGAEYVFGVDDDDGYDSDEYYQ